MDKNEKTQVAAYYLWQNNGCPEGRSEEFWFEAAKMMDCSCNKAKKAMPAKKKSYSAVKAKSSLK